MQIEIGVLIGIGVWLSILSIGLVILFGFLRRLTKDAGEIDLKKILDKILSTQQKNTDSIDDVKREIARIEDFDKLHVQKVGIVRFNPFSEIGGDHSFSLALLDGRDTGVVITGLHTRERTRVYIKAVNGGKSETELSSEEKKAVLKAQRL